MGAETKTLQNVHVARVMADEGLILVRGPVPGGNGSYVSIRRSHKQAVRAAHKAAKGKK
jgi:ribosomal protein L3